MRERIGLQKRKLIGLLILLCLLTICEFGFRIFTIANIPKSYMVTTDNYFDYQKNSECGAYASAYVIRSLGDKVDALDLYSRITDKSEDEGISPNALESYLKSEGYKVKVGLGTLTNLKMRISKGTPVVILAKAYPDADFLHYMAVVGYDEEYFYLYDSIEELAIEETYYNRKIPKDDFKNMWDNDEVRNLYIYINR